MQIEFQISIFAEVKLDNQINYSLVAYIDRKVDQMITT